MEDGQNSLVTKEIEVVLMADFPLDVFKGRESEYQAVFEYLRMIQEDRETYHDPVDENTDLRSSKINKIMAVYLDEVSSHLRVEFYRELVFFVLMYRKALNKVGWETKSKQTKIEENNHKEFCDVNNGEFMPEICNDFITDLLPEYLKEYDISSFRVIGPEVSQIRNAVFLTMHFCNWLNYHKYTNSRLVLNPDEN